MSYNSSIPQASDPRALSQSQIKANFQAINAVFANNHTPLTSNVPTIGMHTVLTMRPQNPAPSTSTGQVALYNKLDSNSVPELFFRPQGNATPIQLTYPSVGASTSPFRYYTFVAGPFVVYAGYVSNPTNGQVITLTPTTTLIYAGVTEAAHDTANDYRFSTATNLSGSTFTIKFVTGGTPTNSVYFLAIGKP